MKFWYVSVTILVFVCDLKRCRPEIYTASAHLESILSVENSVRNQIKNYLNSETARIEKIRRATLSIVTEKSIFKDSAPTFKSLIKFQKMKSLKNHWKFVRILMESGNLELEYFRNITGFPTAEDLTGASYAIFRLQDVYNLRPSDMADGILYGATKSAEKMSASDCFELGRQAYMAEDYYHCILWMEEARIRSNCKNSSKPSIDEIQVLDYLSFSNYQQGNHLVATQMAETIAKLRPNDQRAQDNFNFYRQLKATEAESSIREFSVEPQNRRPPGFSDRAQFEELCRADQAKDQHQADLFCYFKRNVPYLLIGGIKVEIIHRKPIVKIFRGLLSDAEITTIKRLATPKLSRAQVFNQGTGKLEVASYRITKSAWLKPEDHPLVAIIHNRVEMMTNLDKLAAEPLQVANYGLGGHYNPHFDHTTGPVTDVDGNRIATVLFYLNAPIAGGATVIIPLNLTVAPTKGDALFWYNLRPSGEPDSRTRHAGCPVLAGQKWVANVWIRERGQEFRRRCGLSYESEL